MIELRSIYSILVQPHPLPWARKIKEEETKEWVRVEKTKKRKRGWLLFVSFVFIYVIIDQVTLEVLVRHANYANKLTKILNRKFHKLIIKKNKHM